MIKGASQLLALAVALALSAAWGTTPVHAAVERDDHATISKGLPVYSWIDTNRTPRAIAIAVHGLAMHGGTFDTMARSLAMHGITVYAQDLRGYGRWLHDTSFESKTSNRINYEASYNDLLPLISDARATYPDLPIFCVGESLGADLVMRAAGDKPDQISGIVLSSPAVKTQSFILPMMRLGGPAMAAPTRQMNMVGYIKKFASEDPQITAGAVQDPLVRKKLSAVDLIGTLITVKPALGYAKRVPENVPVLVIQGSKDRMVRAKAVIKLLTELKSTDQTVRWFPERGHLLLETSYVRPDTMETLQDWLLQRVHKAELARGLQPPYNQQPQPITTSSPFLETLSLARTSLLPP